MILRGLAIWTGVGLGHLAALGALWSGAAPSPSGAAFVLDLRFVAVAAPVPRHPATLPSPGIAGEPAIPAVPLRPIQEASQRVFPSVNGDPSPAALPLPPSPHSPITAPPAARPVLATPPRFLERVEPAYPPRALRAGIEGAVTLALRLSESGELLEVRVLRGSGSELLDQAALAAARASRFEPASLDGRPVDAQTEATYRFVLR
jgi:protein TonB